MGANSLVGIFVILLFANGCTAAAPATSTDTKGQVTSTGAKNKVATKPEKWEPLVEGSDLSVDVNHKWYPEEMKLSNGTYLHGWRWNGKWNGFLKGYVESFPIEKRDAVVKGLTRYFTTYDKVEDVIKFTRPGLAYAPYYRGDYVALRGTIDESNEADALLEIHYQGDSWLFTNRITVVADEFKWESPNLDFYKDHDSSGVWEYTLLDLSNPNIRKVADKIASSDEVIIRFYGKQYNHDFEVPHMMKQDLALILEAMDTINGT